MCKHHGVINSAGQPVLLRFSVYMDLLTRGFMTSTRCVICCSALTRPIHNSVDGRRWRVYYVSLRVLLDLSSILPDFITEVGLLK